MTLPTETDSVEVSMRSDVEIRERPVEDVLKSLDAYLEFALARNCASDAYFYRELHALIRKQRTEVNEQADMIKRLSRCARSMAQILVGED